MFKCDVCSTKFSRKWTLKNHMITHTGERPYSCSYCEATFTQSASRNGHERTIHSVNSVKFICNVCSKTFLRKCSLKSHMVTHTVERPYSCSSCKATFKRSKERNQHERFVHSENSVKFNKCDVCSKTFLTKTILKRHMITHTVERPYSCAYCNARFKRSTSRNEHERFVHSENSVKLKCDVCSKTFLTKSNLKRHMVAHTDERPYSCSSCEATFKQPEYRKKHERLVHSVKFKSNEYSKSYSRHNVQTFHKKGKQHHPPRNITCDLCDKEFVDSHELLQHTHKSHPEVDQQHGLNS